MASVWSLTPGLVFWWKLFVDLLFVHNVRMRRVFDVIVRGRCLVLECDTCAVGRGWFSVCLRFSRVDARLLVQS